MSESKPKQKMHRLEAGRFDQAEYTQHEWRAKAEQGVTIDDLKDQAYWTNFGHRMTPWDRVIVTTEDGTLWAELLVLSCGRTWARMHVLRHVNLSTSDVEQTQSSENTQAEYRYEWKGPNKKHCIVRSDGMIIHEGSQSKADALFVAKQQNIELAT